MPSSDYASSGGGLRLKGAKDAGIDKKKKKKRSIAVEDVGQRESSLDAGRVSVRKTSVGDTADHQPVAQDGESHASTGRTKTEAEMRHEEMRRKRLDERLKREGVKTHKERVEELNKYLSGLSEHHDMPKIGPG